MPPRAVPPHPPPDNNDDEELSRETETGFTWPAMPTRLRTDPMANAAALARLVGAIADHAGGAIADPPGGVEEMLSFFLNLVCQLLVAKIQMATNSPAIFELVESGVPAPVIDFGINAPAFVDQLLELVDQHGGSEFQKILFQCLAIMLEFGGMQTQLLTNGGIYAIFRFIQNQLTSHRGPEEPTNVKFACSFLMDLAQRGSNEEVTDWLEQAGAATLYARVFQLAHQQSDLQMTALLGILHLLRHHKESTKSAFLANASVDKVVATLCSFSTTHNVRTQIRLLILLSLVIPQQPDILEAVQTSDCCDHAIQLLKDNKDSRPYAVSTVSAFLNSMTDGLPGMASILASKGVALDVLACLQNIQPDVEYGYSIDSAFNFLRVLYCANQEAVKESFDSADGLVLVLKAKNLQYPDNESVLEAVGRLLLHHMVKDYKCDDIAALEGRGGPISFVGEMQRFPNNDILCCHAIASTQLIIRGLPDLYAFEEWLSESKVISTLIVHLHRHPPLICLGSILLGGVMKETQAFAREIFDAGGISLFSSVLSDSDGVGDSVRELLEALAGVSDPEIRTAAAEALQQVL